jgi:hypothetical protein
MPHAWRRPVAVVRPLEEAHDGLIPFAASPTTARRSDRMPKDKPRRESRKPKKKAATPKASPAAPQRPASA